MSETKQKTIDDFTDQELIEAIDTRNLYEEVFEECLERSGKEYIFQEDCKEVHLSDFRGNTSHELSEVDKQKIELYTAHMDRLKWEQWNYIFKDVARRSKEEIAAMGRDLSLMPDEIIS